MPDKKSLLWEDYNWRHWVYIAVNMDLGPDGLCASNAFEYKWFLNFDRIGDFAHGIHCDWPLVLKKNKLYNFFMCLSVSFNLVFGPDKKTREETLIEWRLACVVPEGRAHRHANLHGEAQRHRELPQAQRL